MNRISTRPDPDAETVLNFVNAEFVVKDVTLEEIDWVASSNNCARLYEPLKDEKIEDYHQSMSRGDIFPMTVLESTAKGLVILGGNQRMSAMKRLTGEPIVVAAYVVRPLAEHMRDVVIRSLNSRHGWGSEKEERIVHAVYMVQKHGIAVSDAAKLMVVSESIILDRMRAESVRVNLARKGVDASKMPTSSLVALARVKNEKALIALASTAVKQKATAPQIAATAKAVEAATSIGEVNKIVKQFDTELQSSVKAETKSASRIKRPRRDRFLRYMETLSHFLERENDGTGFSTFAELQCSGDDLDKVRAMAAKITIRLKVITEVHDV